MMNFKKNVLTISALLCSTFLSAQNFDISGVSFKIISEDAQTAELTDGKTVSGEYVIPKTVSYVGKEYKVTSIAKGAFKNTKGLTTVDFSNVTQIGEQAFCGCSDLSDLVNTDSIMSVGHWAFEETPWFNSKTGLVTLGRVAYYYNSDNYSGTDLVLDKHILTIAQGCFEDLASIQTLDLNNVQNVGDNAFAFCVNLKTLDLKKVKTIGVGAFKECTNLQSVNFQHLKKIEAGAFSNCLGLTTLDLNEVESIERVAFLKCTNLTSVDLKNVKSIGSQAFKSCTNLIDITSLENVDSVDSYAFDKTAWLETQPEGPVYMGKQLYKYQGVMPENTKITVKDGIRQILNGAFMNCKNLAAIDLNQVEYIGAQSFQGCTGLVDIDMKKAKTLGRYAFQGCTGLASVDTKEVVSMGEFAFQNCSALKDVTLRNVSIIENGTFAGCSSLKFVDLGKACEMRAGASPFFSAGAFQDCKSLESVDLKGVQKVSFASFRNCTALTSIVMGNVSSLGSYVFDGCKSVTSIDFANMQKIDAAAFKSCKLLKNVRFGVNTQEIVNSDKNFLGFEKVEQVNVEANEPPVLSANFFKAYDAKVTVPLGTKEKYSSTEVWMNFANMEESETTGITEVGTSKIVVKAVDGNIYVTGVPAGEVVTAYDASGRILCSCVCSGQLVSLPVVGEKVVIVKVRANSIKVMM